MRNDDLFSHFYNNYFNLHVSKFVQVSKLFNLTHTYNVLYNYVNAKITLHLDGLAISAMITTTICNYILLQLR